MYEIDERDQVVELTEIPEPDVGAPNPHMIASEYRTVIMYERNTSRDGADPFSGATSFAMLSCQPIAIYFGGPNDEALSGHPLYGRGLGPYSAYEVIDSSWIRLMEVRNRVHWRHDPNRFLSLRHIIIAFHDSILEFVTREFEIERWDGSERDAPAKMLDQFLNWTARPTA
jgi:hypothetical protein